MATTLPSERPFCHTDGCFNYAAPTLYLDDGRVRWRKWCNQCHQTRTAAKHGLKKISEITAKRAGFDNVTDFKNSIHPYRKHRKNFCENIDGRLGFTCTTTIVWAGMLDVDHKDGNPANNSEDNLQTLCKCCHAYKTNQEQDWSTPGRKELGITY